MSIISIGTVNESSQFNSNICQKTFTKTATLNRHFAQKHKEFDDDNKEPSEETKKEYYEECRNDIDTFRNQYEKCQKFGLSKTPKFHVITDHFLDYIQMLEKTLNETNDQVIETFHQDLKTVREIMNHFCNW